MSNCRALEKQITVAFLGPLGTFSEEASMKQFGESIEPIQTSSIDEVFHLVESHKAHYGVVPVENSTEGAINRTLDLLLTSNAMICAEIILPVHHNLISNEKDVSSIKKIYSHTQSLSQCHQWLLNHAPGIELQSVSSNAEAVKIASKEKGVAAVASNRAAALFNVPLLAENIEDDPKNSTRFLVISNHEVKPSGLDKTSIIVAAKNQPGAIASMIEPFAKNKVSMTKLESRPSKTGLWEYVFFIDIEGHMTDSKVADSLKEIESKASFLKVLGSYPQSNLT
jgi:chorismate mutase/prephenate dehydratase